MNSRKSSVKPLWSLCDFSIFKVMEPPSRQSNDYFYYRPNSPHYEDHDHHGHGGGDLSTSASNHNYNYERKVDDFAIEDLGR